MLQYFSCKPYGQGRLVGIIIALLLRFAFLFRDLFSFRYIQFIQISFRSYSGLISSITIVLWSREPQPQGAGKEDPFNIIGSDEKSKESLKRWQYKLFPLTLWGSSLPGGLLKLLHLSHALCSDPLLELDPNQHERKFFCLQSHLQSSSPTPKN